MTIRAYSAASGSSRRARYWSGRLLLAILAVCALSHPSYAGVLSWSGTILQSPSDAGQTAANNPSLNGIFDFQGYFVNLIFPGEIAAPGTYNLTGSSLTFTVASAPASEAAFDVISLTITPNGSFDDFSLLGCLTTGSGCFVGNQLDANFEIPAAALNSQSVTATGLDQPHPLDLLEDDGGSEVQASITAYSYTATAAATPEPSTLALLCLAAVLAAGWAFSRRGIRFQTENKENR